MKRLLDIVIALSALMLLWPILLFVSVAIALESGFPILFRQTRVGRGGSEFGMYKFRSMVKNAAAIGSYQTSAGDPRITAFGGVLRRTSIDELPQLFNVVKGEMSIVGPRPDVPAQRSLYSDAEWAERCSVRPGITGLAQAKIRSEATQEERLALDLQYARDHSLRLDVQIIWWTLGRLTGKGGN